MQRIDQQKDFFITRWWLEQWAAWVCSGGSGSVHPIAAMMKEAIDSESNNCCITDDDALIIDRGLARLKRRNIETGRVTMSYFIHRCNASIVAGYMNINRNKVSVVANSGIAWMDAYLEDKELQDCVH